MAETILTCLVVASFYEMLMMTLLRGDCWIGEGNRKEKMTTCDALVYGEQEQVQAVIVPPIEQGEYVCQNRGVLAPCSR